MKILDKSYNEASLTCLLGDIIVINLDENPTTGYFWSIKSNNENLLKLIKQEYKPMGQGIGGGGINSFYFKVIGRGENVVEIILSNPWEKDCIDSFVIKVES